MVIPDDWLICPESIEEVEEQLAELGAPDLWLAEWRRFVEHFGPDDEFWCYRASVVENPEGAAWEITSDWVFGYARVRDGEVVESIPSERH